MKIAYLLLVHQHPKLITRAVERLAAPGCSFFIHVDAKADFAEFLVLSRPNVNFTPTRVPVVWGEFSQVEAILILIRQALAARENYDYLILLSGSDYPLRSAPFINMYLDHRSGSEFMSMVEVPNKAAGKPLSRLTTWRFPRSRPLLRLTFRLLAKANLATRDHRRFLGSLTPYSGSTWWALSRRACEYIVKFHDQHPEIANFFRFTFAADESYFHTILGNSPFRERLRRNLSFEDWSNGNAHPCVITARHIARFKEQARVASDDLLTSTEFLFARKFSDRSFGLLDEIDEIIQAVDANLLDRASGR